MENIAGHQVIRLTSTDSTNNYANNQIRVGLVDEGTVFLTDHQTAGRGQTSNFWESEPGMNLTFSIVLHPDFLEIRQQYMISKVVTLGIYQALNKYVDSLKIKWPNDIYAGNGKLGGILIENSIMTGQIKSSVVGIGLNINQTVFKSNAPNPVSLQMLTNQHFDCDNILTQILAFADHYYWLLREGEFDKIDQEFLSVMYRLNQPHFYKTDHEVFEGEIIGVNDIGQLLIRKNSGLILKFHFKEVEFI